MTLIYSNGSIATAVFIVHAYLTGGAHVPRITRGSLGHPMRVCLVNISAGSAVFARLTIVTDQHERTDHVLRQDVCIPTPRIYFLSGRDVSK